MSPAEFKHVIDRVTHYALATLGVGVLLAFAWLLALMLTGCD